MGTGWNRVSVDGCRERAGVSQFCRPDGYAPFDVKENRRVVVFCQYKGEYLSFQPTSFVLIGAPIIEDTQHNLELCGTRVR
jgi:hypothetical protein